MKWCFFMMENPLGSILNLTVDLMNKIRALKYPDMT